ncbi:MAG: alpha/beta fold hydrolase [Oscillospiraceae bacterium]|nr:alpha/beta fold hydrolase [Oscillospiraceae bacterium]
MGITVTPFSVKSTDNLHTLKGKVYIPEGKPLGHFQIVHGMTEHIGRYDEFMRKIAESGYICFGFDNLGHGNTAENDAELGFIAERGGDEFLVYDVIEFYRAVKHKYPAPRYILMGHSMGSFIARLTAEKFSHLVDALIICGTAGKNPFAAIGLCLCKIIAKIKGETHRSELLQKIAFGSYNNRFEKLSEYDWLTTDRSIIEKYEQDKFCNFNFTVSAMADLMRLIKNCNADKWYEGMAKENPYLPILLISGKLDPVGNFGRGVSEVYKKLRAFGQKDTNMFLYKNARHEILNDTCREEVLDDILDFITN